MPAETSGSSAASRGGSSSSSSRRPGHKRQEKEVDLVTRMRFSNSLPDIPFDPKFLQCPFVDLNRFVAYKTTSLERNYKHEVLTEPDLGVHIDLIDPQTYAIDAETLSNLQMDPLDEKLLEDETAAKGNARRSAQHNRVVPWMRKTEYISSEYNRFGTQTERQETKVGYNIKKRFKEDNIYRNRQEQLDAIGRTFAEAAKPVTAHHSKPGVLPVAELPVLPDFDLWKFPFAQVIFDSDPMPAGTDAVVGAAKMSQALIRGMMDESGEQFVAYFLPTDQTLDKRRRAQERKEQGLPDDHQEEGLDEEEAAAKKQAEAAHDYRLAREYNWTVKNKASKNYEENYLFVLRKDSVTYNELETRVRLSRRRAKEGAPKTANSRLIVTQRAFSEEEVGAQEERLLQLAPPQEEEDDDDDDADKADKPDGDKDGEEDAQEGDAAKKRSASESSDKDAEGPPAKAPRKDSDDSADSDSD